MSFEIKYGDLFANVHEGYVLHGCNAQGVMGSGVARIVRNLYPVAYEEYKAHHNEIGLNLGDVIPVIVTPNLVILNGVTQHLFGRDGGPYVDYSALQTVFEDSTRLAASGIVACTDLHMPLVGGGLGGGDPILITEMMRDVFETVNIKVTLWLLES
jgi:O-acetyl-ADP-ribose deacetylase (regulator of RNase III)